MQAMVNLNFYIEKIKTNNHTIYIERKEQKRREKDLKDKEDASNGKLNDEHVLRNTKLMIPLFLIRT